VDLCIVQPRAQDAEGKRVRFVTVTPAEIMDWATFILLPAVKATMAAKPALVVGDHCHYCRALAICSAHTEHALEVARTGLLSPEPPAPESLTPEQVAKVLVASDLIREWSKKVRAYAQSRLEAGASIPGFKLVQAKANRQWVCPPDAERELVKHLGEGALIRKLISPAQAEKALKEKGQNPKELLELLAEKPDKGLTLAPESDRRQAVIVQPFLENLAFLE
jgi:hypothetical protein